MTANEDLESSVETIAADECLRLVATLAIGRIAVALPGGPPLVVPVNYVLDGDVVVFRSDIGSKVHALREQPVSFQVDFVDPFHRTGWSVLIQGVAREAEPTEIAHLELRSWAGGDKRLWIRVLPASITGRTIRLADIERDPRGYL